MAYVLTKTGIRNVKRYIQDLQAKRKKIIDAGKDTCHETKLPSIKNIEVCVNWAAENGEYRDTFGVTDHYDGDYPICLHEGIDYVEKEGNL